MLGWGEFVGLEQVGGHGMNWFILLGWLLLDLNASVCEPVKVGWLLHGFQILVHKQSSNLALNWYAFHSKQVNLASQFIKHPWVFFSYVFLSSFYPLSALLSCSFLSFLWSQA